MHETSMQVILVGDFSSWESVSTQVNDGESQLKPAQIASNVLMKIREKQMNELILNWSKI